MVIAQLAAKFPRIVFYSRHLQIQIPIGAHSSSKILKIKIVLQKVEKNWFCLLFDTIEDFY